MSPEPNMNVNTNREVRSEKFEWQSSIILSVHPRFFAPEAQTSGDLVTLSAEEAQHLTRVLRLGAGAAVRVFNGIGDEFESVVEAATKDVVQVRIGNPRDPVPESRFRVSLAQAVLKGDKMDDVVRDAVMMGASAIRPVLTARTETSVAVLEKSHRRERWERVAISSAKQCGRAVIPPILAPVTLDVLIQTPAGYVVGWPCNHAGRARSGQVRGPVF